VLPEDDMRYAIETCRTLCIQLVLDVQEALERHVLERGCQVSISVQGGI